MTFTYPKEWFDDGFDPKTLETGNYWLAPRELMKFMQMTWEELRQELAAGRLVCQGVPLPDGRGYSDLSIHMGKVIAWFATEHGQKYWRRRKSA